MVCVRTLPGCSSKGAPLDIVSAFQSYGQKVGGIIEEEERLDIIANSCPGVGACGGMYTANTMASAIEAMGMSLPNSSSMPADSQEKVRARWYWFGSDCRTNSFRFGSDLHLHVNIGLIRTTRHHACPPQTAAR